MEVVHSGNRIRRHRKKSGLTQEELARILGYADDGAVSRHEQSMTVPPLLIAIAYQAVFQVPISDLFPGIQSAVEQAVARRLVELEAGLLERINNAKRRRLAAQKLAWLDERRALEEKKSFSHEY
jgi:transcriptional regulator with XRE-family HTH domain